VAAGCLGVKDIAKNSQRFLHDSQKINDGRHGGSLLMSLKALGRSRVALHYTLSSLLCKTSDII
jgi:hypothetical protein